MSGEPIHANAGPLFVATAESRKAAPPWIVEAATVLRCWRSWGLVDALRAIHWNRPGKRYALVDVVLVLLLFAVSNARGLTDFYDQLEGFQQPLASLWGRDRIFSRSGLITALRALDADCLAQIDTLFLQT